MLYLSIVCAAGKLSSAPEAFVRRDFVELKPAGRDSLNVPLRQPARELVAVLERKGGLNEERCTPQSVPTLELPLSLQESRCLFAGSV